MPTTTINPLRFMVQASEVRNRKNCPICHRSMEHVTAHNDVKAFVCLTDRVCLPDTGEDYAQNTQNLMLH